MQVTIWLGWEAGADRFMPAAGEVVADELADEVPFLRRQGVGALRGMRRGASRNTVWAAVSGRMWAGHGHVGSVRGTTCSVAEALQAVRS
jgi:hypothetical protein